MTTPELKLRQLTIRQVVQATLLVLLVAAVFYFLYRFHQVFLTMFVAIVLSTAIQPIVGMLNKRGVSKELGIILVYILIIVLLVGGILLLVPMIAQQSDLLVDTIPETYQQIREDMLSHPNFLIWRIATELPESMSLAPGPPPVEEGEDVIENVGQNLELIGLGARGVFITFAALVLAFYWTLEGQKNKTALLLLVPMEHRESAREITAEIQARLGAFVRGQAILAGIIGSLSFVAYLLIGLPYAIALAIVAGIMETVPVLGPILGAIPALVVAYTVDPGKAVLVLVATAVIQQLENNLLVPRVMKRAVGVNPLVTLLALTAFGTLFGILGAVVAIPLAAIIQLLLDRFVMNSTIPDESDIAGRDKASVLRYEAQELIKDIRSSVRKKDISSNDETDQIEDSIEAIAIDLDAALAASQNGKEEIVGKVPN